MHLTLFMQGMHGSKHEFLEYEIRSSVISSAGIEKYIWCGSAVVLNLFITPCELVRPLSIVSVVLGDIQKIWL